MDECQRTFKSIILPETGL